MRRGSILTYGAMLIGTYLVVAHASGAGTLLTKGGDSASKLVKTLQGRG